MFTFLSFQLFVYNSAVCLHFSCLFTFQLFVYFLSFVNKQLFVYNSAVCLHFSANFRFWLFCSKLTPVQRQYPFSVFVNISQFSAVCLHSQSAVCLHFSVFVNKQLTFSEKSRFWLFRTKLTSVQRQYPFSVYVNKQLTLFTFSQFSGVCLHSQSAVCLLFLSFCKQTADYSSKSRFWLFCSNLTSVQRQYPFSVFDSWLCLHFLSFCKQTADFCKQTADFSVFVNKQLISWQNSGFDISERSWPQFNASTRLRVD